MGSFVRLLRQNRNYRYTWLGQIVSEMGDNFNTVAVFSLALSNTGSGLVVSGLMISRALPMILAGPLAGVLLDRMDRKRLMIASDLFRAAIAVLFIFSTRPEQTWLLYIWSALLMFGSPFFTSGRAAILPTITTREELHTANSLTKTTQWTALTVGAMLGGASAMQFGYQGAFIFNALSFLFSAACIWQLRAPKGFRPARTALTESRVLRPFHEYIDGLRYMRSVPLLMAIGLVHIGWASGGGAAQILFTLFGEVVYPYGPAGLGTIWGFAGVGLLVGGAFANWVGARLSFDQFKRLITVCFALHGLAYIAFSQVKPFWMVLVFIALSRAGMGVAAVLNTTLLLKHVPDEFRGRVFATIESLVWGTMMISMAAAGFASGYWDPRTIGAAAGILSTSTAFIWFAADWKGRLKEPEPLGVESEEVEVHGDPAV
jgi:MFS family permease